MKTFAFNSQHTTSLTTATKNSTIFYFPARIEMRCRNFFQSRLSYNHVGLNDGIGCGYVPQIKSFIILWGVTLLRTSDKKRKIPTQSLHHYENGDDPIYFSLCVH